MGILNSSMLRLFNLCETDNEYCMFAVSVTRRSLSLITNLTQNGLFRQMVIISDGLSIFVHRFFFLLIFF